MYNVILIVFILLFAAFSQIMVIKAVKFGLKISEKPEKATEDPIFHIPKKKKQPKMTPEEQRTVQILANIDRYDGTSLGQVKVEKNG